jgi:ABC-2 type transport system ATP-binding protein
LLLSLGDRLTVAVEAYNLKKEFIKERRFGEILLHPFRKPEVVRALKGVSLKINKGELCVLLGPNGAGKTTLIKILSTIILPDSGKAFIDGYDVVKQEWKAKNSLGLIHSEERSFFWRLTGRQNLEFFAKLYNIKGKEVKKRVNFALKVVDLCDERADMRFDGYSTGMKRRLSIARGLLMDPDVLLVDEPTSGVDPINATKIRKFLKEELVKKRKKTILMTTHDLREAQELCDSIYIINKGKVKAAGSLAKLQSKIGAEQIHLEIDAEKKAIEKIKKLKSVRSLEMVGNKLKIEVTDSHSALPEIIDTILKYNGRIYDCKTSHVDLDVIFEKFVGD